MEISRTLRISYRRGHDGLVAAAWDGATGSVIYRTDQHLVDLGYQGADAYAKDDNGNPIVEAVRPPNPKMLRFLLEFMFPEKYGKHRKIDISQKGGVLVIGESNKEFDYSSVASIRARKRKSGSRKIREAKA